MHTRRYRLAGLLWTLPALIAVVGILIYPLVQNVRLSFHTWSVFAPDEVFIGLENYVRAVADPVFWTALLNNVAYAIVSLIFQIGVALALAAVLDQFIARRFQGFFRSVYFLPATLSITITSVLFTFIYHPEVGILNSALDFLGLEGLKHVWLGDPTTAMGAVIAMSQWQWTGYNAILLLVAIQRIPREYYEASSLDGAGRIRQFFTITVPLSRDMITVLSITVISNAFLVFNEVTVMTNGGPNNSTQVLGTLIYQNAFRNDDMGYAAALGTVVLIVTVVIGIVQVILSGRKQVTY
ncbi:carbohydrate ABC transporter permease [Microbacterium sp. YY-03]|uniref:Sugar ABC transporter permease n=1 Tax=Microbacterium mitrae TaxID=664640 RepID=A0A5C8HTA2_9MICO|nr:sugar ABC transporter permease [Microbacterium mitrae]TXK06251.1 sugar ABC transporter permease [Microbacterium mitrae]